MNKTFEPLASQYIKLKQPYFYNKKDIKEDKITVPDKNFSVFYIDTPNHEEFTQLKNKIYYETIEKIGSKEAKVFIKYKKLVTSNIYLQSLPDEQLISFDKMFCKFVFNKDQNTYTYTFYIS